MASLEEVLDRFTRHTGVRQAVLLGADGLVIAHSRSMAADPDTVAAAIPPVVNAARTLADGIAAGNLRTLVVEVERFMVLLHPVSAELILAGIVDPGTGFAPLLADFRSEGRRLTQLL